MSALPTPLYTYNEYLAWQLRYPDFKWELIDGVIYAMAGGTAAHAAMAMRIGHLLYAAAETHNCTVYGSDLNVKLNDFTGLYPDVTVVCGPLDPNATYTRQPCLVIEVLSPATRQADLGRKRESYLALDTVQQYLVIDLSARAIYEWQPQLDAPIVRLDGATITLVGPPMELPVSAVFG